MLKFSVNGSIQEISKLFIENDSNIVRVWETASES